MPRGPKPLRHYAITPLRHYAIHHYAITLHRPNHYAAPPQPLRVMVCVVEALRVMVYVVENVVEHFVDDVGNVLQILMMFERFETCCPLPPFEGYWGVFVICVARVCVICVCNMCVQYV